MFGIGTGELLLILVLALIVLGPRRLPGIAKSLGRGYAEFKRASQELREGIASDISVSDFRASINEARRTMEADIAFPDKYGRDNRSFHIEDLKPSDFEPDVKRETAETGSETLHVADEAREQNSKESFPAGRGHDDSSPENSVNSEKRKGPDPEALSG